MYSTNSYHFLLLQDGVLIENMHDIPYLKAKSLTPETTAFMTRVATEVRNILPKSVKCGVQVRISSVTVKILSEGVIIKMDLQ